MNNLLTPIRNSLKKQQLTIKETLAYGSGMFAVGIGGMGTAIYLTFFWTDIALIPLTAVTLIMLLSRVFDALNDVISAWLIDRTNSKHGKARSWILYWTIPATIASIALFYTPNFSLAGKIIWAAVMYNIVNTVYSDFVLIPVTSLVSLMTPDTKGRVTLNIAGQLGQTLAAVLGSLTLVSGIAFFGDGQKGYFGYFAVLSVAMAIGLLFCFSGSTEKVKQADETAEKIKFWEGLKLVLTNKWWFLSIGSQAFIFMLMTFMAVNIYYMQYIVQNLAILTLFATLMNVGQLIVPFFIPVLMKKFSPINSSIILLIISLFGFLLPLVNLTSIPIIAISAIFRGVGISSAMSTRFAILSDVVDYCECTTGKRIDALIFSGSSFAAKIGMALASALITIVLGAAGYVGGAAIQVASANNAIIFLFTAVNGLFILGTILCLIGLRPLDQKMGEIRTNLEMKRNGNQQVS